MIRITFNYTKTHHMPHQMQAPINPVMRRTFVPPDERRWDVEFTNSEFNKPRTGISTSSVRRLMNVALEYGWFLHLD